MSKKQLPSQVENPKGLHAKFFIQKIVGYLRSRPIYQDIGPNEEYFPLRLDDGCKNPEHLKACRAAITTYAKTIEKSNPVLAKEIRERYLN